MIRVVDDEPKETIEKIYEDFNRIAEIIKEALKTSVDSGIDVPKLSDILGHVVTISKYYDRPLYTIRKNYSNGFVTANVIDIYCIRDLFRSIILKHTNNEVNNWSYNGEFDRTHRKFQEKIKRICLAAANKMKDKANDEFEKVRKPLSLNEIVFDSIDCDKVSSNRDIHMYIGHDYFNQLASCGIIRWYTFFSSRVLELQHIDGLIYNNNLSFEKVMDQISNTNFKVSNEIIEKYKKHLNFKKITKTRFSKIPNNLRIELQLSGKV